MSKYVDLSIRIETFNQIIDALMSYCSKLDNYLDMEDTVHLIDYLQDEYEDNMYKQDIEFAKWLEYGKLFNERFENKEFRDNDGKLNEKAIYEYKNFNKVNKVLEDYKEGGTLSILESKQQFFLVLDLLKTMNCEEWNNDE